MARIAQLFMNNAQYVSYYFLSMVLSLQDHVNQVYLMSSDSVYLSPVRSREQAAWAPHSAWNIVRVPTDYLANAWPLRVS